MKAEWIKAGAYCAGGIIFGFLVGVFVSGGAESLREWLLALSGWVAACAAGATVVWLDRGQREERDRRHSDELWRREDAALMRWNTITKMLAAEASIENLMNAKKTIKEAVSENSKTHEKADLSKVYFRVRAILRIIRKPDIQQIATCDAEIAGLIKSIEELVLSWGEGNQVTVTEVSAVGELSEIASFENDEIDRAVGSATLSDLIRGIESLNLRFLRIKRAFINNELAVLLDAQQRRKDPQFYLKWLLFGAVDIDH